MTIVRIAALAACLLAPAAALAQGLGISKQQVIEIFASADVPLQEEPASPGQGSQGTRLTGGKEGPRLSLVGPADNLTAIRIDVATLATDLEKTMAGVGRLMQHVAPELGEPPTWTQQQGPQPHEKPVPKDFGWVSQFVTETWHGYYTQTLHIDRWVGDTQIVFEGVPPDFFVVTLIPHSESQLRRDVYAHPKSRDPEVRKIAEMFERAQYRVALERLVLLAEAGNADAQALLGDSYYFSRGVRQDHKVARGWYEKAAQRGSVSGYYGLGVVESTKDIGKPPAPAAEWFRKAALLGHPHAQFMLARHYLNGSGVPQSDAEGVRWCTIAAQLGDASGQACLASALAGGHGRARDVTEAYFWWMVALSDIRPDGMLYGQFSGQKVRLGAQLTDTQRKDIERRAAGRTPLTFDEIKQRCGEIDCPAELVASIGAGATGAK
jgi:TPR repeat protein